MVNHLNKRTIHSALATLLVAGVCTAQSAQSEGSGSTLPQTSVAAAPNASPLPAGTTLQAELIKPVDARKNKPGAEVLATVTHDLKVNGSVVIPKGSRLVGHVTEVKARSKDPATSDVGIAFDRAVLKNGTEMSLALGIQAIGRSMPPGESELASGATTVAPGGLLGGVGSTTTGAASDVGSGARSAGLAPTSQGVVGLRGLSLSSHTSASSQGSVISSSTGNVHLDSGTEMILHVSQ
jgi:type F conjugative transfer system protein TrbI